MKIPEKVPEKGFYYHYKHNPALSINNYAYELIGVGIHSEENCRPEDANMAIYLPIYESSAFKSGKFFVLRPLDMFMGDVVKDLPAQAGEKTFPRFIKITDEKVIEELEKIKADMYRG
ncbi:MAG TPA: DUF1653 domain-containing protein [Candidatus Paceibacterota bacterium]